MQPLQDIPLDTVLIDKHNVIWFGGAEGIFRFALNEHRNLPPSPPLLRQLRSLGGTAFYTGGAIPTQLALNANSTDLRFEYASPNFSHLFQSEFQVKLQGHDQSWSGWSNELYRDYTNLTGGDYQFIVRSRDHQGNLLFSRPINIQIAHPWYASPLAWLSYLLLTLLLLYLLLKWRTYHLLQEKRQLTAIVEQRTAHLHHTMAQLEQAKLRAEDAAKAKTEFLANMSHELRTPLNAVLGFAELAQQDTSVARQHDYLLKIRAAGKILLSIINDILDFSKIDAGKVNLEQAPFSLRDTLTQVTDMFSAQLKEKALLFTLQLDDSIADTLKGDALRLSQVLINLLSNAIKFTEQGEITLRIKQINPDNNAGQCTLQFSVTDTGIGISAVQQQQLFNAFTQADNSISRKYGGTGLGLTISQRLVNLMGGQLQLNSVQHKGSCFSFSLTFEVLHATALAAASSSECVAVAPAALNPSDTVQQRILLVEDNYFNQALAQIILQKLGYHITVANSGEQALQQLMQHNVTLILMDIEMPGINGYQTTRQLRQLAGYKSIPVIAMTAHSSDDVRQNCLQAGINDVLTKPIDAASLAAMLQKWLA
ncbi:MAG: response regulator, partial [Rheinheimera sp.]|nr:response regulator [Rheinheimera sp.]